MRLIIWCWLENQFIFSYRHQLGLMGRIYIILELFLLHYKTLRYKYETIYIYYYIFTLTLQ